MSVVAAQKPITLDEFLAMPVDDLERELIRGEIRERPMTRRNRFHAKVEARLSRLLGNWVATQSPPCGEVYSGEVGCILQRNPDSNVGIDVAYFSAATVARQTDATTMVEGAPVLAVEILSPSDRVEEISEKITIYLEAGVGVVWIVDPTFKTVTIYRQDAPVQLVNVEQRLSGNPHLLGFDVAVAELFA